MQKIITLELSLSMIKKQYSKKSPVCKLSFSFSADQVGENADVRVVGQFNDWNWNDGLILKAKKATYIGSLELTTGNAYEFRYLVNGQEWFNDEAADDYVPSPYFSHNSVAVLEAIEIKKPVKAKAKAKAKVVAKKAKTLKAKAKVVAKPKLVKKATKPAVKATKPAVKTTKTVVKADDLRKIEGIGPKIAGLLKADGIQTFVGLGKAKQAQLKAVLATAGPRFKMHKPTTWPKQAKLAAAGKWEALTKLQDELNGGVKK